MVVHGSPLGFCGVLALYSSVVTLRTIWFDFQKFCVLPTQCICVFCVDLRTNCDYFPVQH